MTVNKNDNDIKVSYPPRVRVSGKSDRKKKLNKKTTKFLKNN